MSFSKMEGFLEKHIEGFFNRKFASDLQLAEIQKNIAHIISRNQKNINDMPFVPNCYKIRMSVPDYGRICSRKSREVLYEFIVRTVMRENLFIEGPLNIKFCRDDAMKRGGCDIKSDYTDKENKADGIDCVDEKTIIIQKPTLKETASMPSEHVYAALTVREGDDIDAHLEIGERQIHLGRREENEFLLTDPNVSRLHAYITFEKYRHILYDANSLNGTFVNGEKITMLCLNDGDVIDIGHSRLVYEVL